MEDSREELCKVCGHEKQGRFCNDCQKETASIIKISVSDSVTAKESLGIEKRQEGVSRWLQKIFQGFKPSDDKKKFPEGVYLERKLDRENDQYDELVRDEKTGKITRECHEPLSAHIGRGSAKWKK